MSFLRAEAEARIKNSQLLRLDRLIDWSRVGCVLGNLGRSGYGPHGYKPLNLLKALILQSWHSLSDPKLEEAVNVRLDFMIFSGFDSNVPDETTFCRFRNLLIKQGLWDEVFNEINRQLISHGLAVNPAEDAVLDATIIESAARPRKEADGIAVDREEEREVVIGDTRLSCDPDARWLKKGARNYFGYKAFVTTDTRDGYIQKVEVLPANASEVSNLDTAIEGLGPKRLYADKGYASCANRQMLKELGIKNGIMFRAARDTALTKWQKIFNRLISRRRYIVEQAFGTLKRRFRMTRASYMSLCKVRAEVIMKALAFNLLKAVNACIRIA